MSRIYRVLDVSRYVIQYSNEKKYRVSNLKLQKLLYFIQASFLLGDRLCFKEKIEAWNFGPVVPEVYRAYRQYASTSIPTVDYDIVGYEYVAKESIHIAEKDKKKINSVIDMFSDYTATELVYITHNQSPWIDAYVEGTNNEITPESIQRYFCEE